MYFAGEVDGEKCNGCRLCIFTCPEPNVISFERSVKKKVVIDARRCKGCGLCVEICPSKAVAIVSVV